MMTIKEAIDFAISSSKSISFFRVQDVEMILANVLQKNRAYIKAFAECILTPEQTDKFKSDYCEYIAGKPLAYIFGYTEFYGLHIHVSDKVLIPRPDTEVIVEESIKIIKRLQLDSTTKIKVLEHGTGSGAIALALASNIDNISICATDISLECLDIAALNYQRLQQAGNISKNSDINFMPSDWYTELLNEKYDLIISNPPYIDKNDPNLDCSVRDYEPHTALFADNWGLAAIEHITSNSCDYLKLGGYILFEHGFTQSAQVTQILESNGFTNITTIKDLAGLPRVTIGNLT